PAGGHSHLRRDPLDGGLTSREAIRMTILSPQAHRVLDFLTVVAFALAPTFVHLTGPAAALAYVLAAVHLTVTLATEFPEGRRKPLPFRGHGALEAVV